MKALLQLCEDLVNEMLRVLVLDQTIHPPILGANPCKQSGPWS
jgi:hypothetical protein